MMRTCCHIRAMTLLLITCLSTSLLFTIIQLTFVPDFHTKKSQVVHGKLNSGVKKEVSAKQAKLPPTILLTSLQKSENRIRKLIDDISLKTKLSTATQTVSPIVSLTSSLTAESSSVPSTKETYSPGMTKAKTTQFKNSTVGTSTYRSAIEITSIDENREKTDGRIQKYLVNTRNCHIPDLDPYDASLKDVVHTAEHVSCRRRPFTFQEGDMIHINWTAVNESINVQNIQGCTYQPIIRPIGDTSGHNSLQVLDPSEMFVDKIKIPQHEFFVVQCYNENEQSIYRNFHSFVLEKRDVEERCERNWKKRRSNGQAPDEDLNVIIVGLDSVSRLNSIRFLKKTRKFLLENLNAVELLGQNIVGDATFENIVPFLSGKYPKDLPWTEENQTTFDNFPFIWKNFSDNGYRTIFLEDCPNGAIFDYEKLGFKNNPTDYYDRHFQLASLSEYYNFNHCLYDKTGTALLLNHAQRIASRFRDKPFFSFVFLTRQTHDVLEQTAAVDETHLNFLRNLENNHVLNNTILFYLSDHGIRYGYIRKFYMGKLEERLPMTFIRVPGWFSGKYPDVMKNLLLNSRRLSTKFDLYETLLDILYFKRKRKRSRHSIGYSLFRELPENRSCKDASIEAHWCTCSGFTSINVNNPSVQMAADLLVKEINSKLKLFSHLCHMYHLANVTSAYEINPYSDDLYISFESYQITVVVHPGGAIFEATVMIQESGAITLLGDISRINSYRHQDRCGVGKYFERLCYCLSNKQ